VQPQSPRGFAENAKCCAINAPLARQPVTPFGAGIASPQATSRGGDIISKGKKLAKVKKLEKKQTLKEFF